MSKTTWAWVSPLALLAAFALAGCGGGGGGGGGGSSSGGGGNTTTLSAFTLQPVAVGDPRVATNNTLSWTASSGASGITYDVYRSTTAGTFSGAPINAIPLTTLNYTDTTAATGTTYYYEVIASASGANSTTATSSSTGTNSATPGGPVAEGIGDPAGCTGGPCVAPGPVFKTGGQINYNTTAGPPASGSFSISIPLDPTVLGHTPVQSDLQSVSIGGETYTPATQGAAFANAISISGNTLTFSSSTANITVPSAYVPETPGTLYTLSAVVDGQKLELTAPAPARDGQFHGNQFHPTVNGTTLTYTIQFVNS